MDIEQVLSEDNDLSRFMSFVDNAGLGYEGEMNTIKEDWDNMCGITVSSNYAGTTNASICFNFYEDGTYRAMIPTSDENRREIFKKALKKELSYLGFWGFFKMWRKSKCHG